MACRRSGPAGDKSARRLDLGVAARQVIRSRSRRTEEPGKTRTHGGGPGGPRTIRFSPVEARWVRMLGKKRVNPATGYVLLRIQGLSIGTKHGIGPVETIVGRHRDFAGRADFPLPPIPSSCRRRGWPQSPTARKSRGRSARTIRSAGRFPSMKRPSSCGRGWSISPRELLHAMEHLGHGRPAHGIARAKLEGNPFWPPELAERAGRLAHERYVASGAAGPSRTQDDKGRVRWTLFGGSEQGPARAFWKGFWTAPGRELPAERPPGFLLSPARCGLWRVARAAERPAPGRVPHPARHGRSLASLRARRAHCPSWTTPYLLSEGERLGRVKYLLTFRPFGSLPKNVRRAYLAGDLHLLPFPGSLVFWGAPPFLQLRRRTAAGHADSAAAPLPAARKPARSAGAAGGLDARAASRPSRARSRQGPAPQHCSGGRIAGAASIGTRTSWPWPTAKTTWPTCSSARRRKILGSTTSRWPATPRFGPTTSGCCWTVRGRAASDPATRRGRAPRGRAVRLSLPVSGDARRAVRNLLASPAGGLSLAENGAAARSWSDAPLGYLTAYRADRPNPAGRSNCGRGCWPGRPHVAAIEAFWRRRNITSIACASTTPANCSMPGSCCGEQPLPREFRPGTVEASPRGDARRLARSPGRHRPTARRRPRAGRRSCGGGSSPSRRAGDAATAASCRSGRARLRQQPADVAPSRSRFIAPPGDRSKWPIGGRSPGWPTASTSTRTTPIASAIRSRSRLLQHHHRDLEALGDYLLDYYRRLIEKAGMADEAAVGDLPFRWQTDFGFPWSGRLARQPAGQDRGARPGGRDSRPRPAPGGDHGRPLRHGLHGRLLREGPRRQRRPAGRGRGRRQPLGHRRA